MKPFYSELESSAGSSFTVDTMASMRDDGMLPKNCKEVVKSKLCSDGIECLLCAR